MRHFIIAIAALGFASTTANAETLYVDGLYAANADIDPSVRTISIETFGGDAGQALSFRLTGLLGSAQIDGQQWYNIVPAAIQNASYAERSASVSAQDDDDALTAAPALGTAAILQGLARSDVTSSRTDPKEEKVCRKKEEGECTTWKTIHHACEILTVSYHPSVHLISGRGKFLYKNSDYLESKTEYCEDDDTTPSIGQIMESLEAQFSRQIRRDLAPRYGEENIRIMERRKGLSKADARIFKDAVRMTKADPTGACAVFNQLEAANPEHLSVLFNIALCSEASGDLEDAHAIYSRAHALNSVKVEVKAGLRRVESKMTAERQIIEHFGDEA